MPASKNRHPHKHVQHHDKHAAPAPKESSANNRVVTIAIIFFAVIGLVVGFLVDSSSIMVMLAATVAGIAAGYFAGQQLKKSLSGK
jgi:ABC-type nickel/cobalt efflux system permease component RcnA